MLRTTADLVKLMKTPDKVVHSTRLIIGLASLIFVMVLPSMSRAVAAIQTKSLFKDLDLPTLLGLCATLVGTYLALVSQYEGRSEKRYEEFKSYVIQETLELKKEVYLELKGYSTTHDQFEARFWEELEIAHKDAKDHLLNMEEKLLAQDRVLRSLEIMIASHSESFGHDAMIKILIETRGAVSKVDARISSISSLNQALSRIKNLEAKIETMIKDQLG